MTATETGYRYPFQPRKVCTAVKKGFLSVLWSHMQTLGKTSIENKRLNSGIARKWGSGLPLPEFFGPFFPAVKNDILRVWQKKLRMMRSKPPHFRAMPEFKRLFSIDIFHKWPKSNGWIYATKYFCPSCSHSGCPWERRREEGTWYRNTQHIWPENWTVHRVKNHFKQIIGQNYF